MDMALDYTKISSVARVRWYMTDNPDLPKEEWPMIKEVSIHSNQHWTDAPNKTGKTQYLTCRYVFLDGKLSGFADVQELKPITTPAESPIKQRFDLN